MNPLLRIATGVIVGYFVVTKLARKPFHRLAVGTAKGVMNVGDRVTGAGNSVVQDWQDIVGEAKVDMEKRKADRLVKEAGSMMDTVSDNVAGYMHKTAETIENLADRLEYRNKEDDNLEVVPGGEE